MFWFQQHFHYFQSQTKKNLIGRALQEIQSLFVCMAWVQSKSEELKKIWLHWPSEITMRSAKFWKCTKQTKIKFWPPPGSVWIGTLQGASKNILLPFHIFHAISLLSQQIEPSNQYLSSWDILSLLFVGWHYLVSAFPPPPPQVRVRIHVRRMPCPLFPKNVF